jgi:hypothetical protein
MSYPQFVHCPVCETCAVKPITRAEHVFFEEPLAYRCSMEHIFMPADATEDDLLEVVSYLISQPALRIQ